MEMKGSKQSGTRPRSKLWPAKALLVLIPLGVVVTFLALFKAAIVNYLGSLEGWYALLSVVLALIALQVGALALQAVAERTEAGAPAALQGVLRRLRPHLAVRLRSLRIRRRG